MADENWQQVRDIFDNALRQKPEERAKFVKEVCGDDKVLRTEVESLLVSFDNAERFMETPAIAGVAEQIWTENRQFSNGQFLTHYEIIERIGAGGMGEVYLATDTKLNRRVALKVLHQNLSSDSKAKERLLYEAQAAAMLDHPHICAIYEIAENGDDSFIVMQYVEGKTLADILVKRLTVEKSLDLAIQIADALAEAHTHRIIHRDIKPANIIVNGKWQAKILDFGLAKFVEAENRQDTVKRLNTSGAVMGTVPYMSPEQLRGKPLDRRTDIFSFGAMFYEMLCGQQAFAGDSHAETISAILNDQPDLTVIPKILQPIVRKCLMKKSGERYQTAESLMGDLLKARQIGKFSAERKKAWTTTTTRIEQNSSPKNAPTDSKSPRFYFWKRSEQNVRAALPTERIGNEKNAATNSTRVNKLAVLLAGLTVFLIVGVAVLFYLQLNKNDDSRQFDALRPMRLVEWKATAGSFYSDFSVSHNGKLVAYSSSQAGGKENIYVKQTTDGEELRVTKDEWTNVSPVWSPDDQRIAYSSLRENQTGIYVCPVLGGTAVSLKIIGKDDIYLRHWSKDGTAIFYEYQNNLFRLDVATQETAQITYFADAPGTERNFSIAPDEDRIAFCEKTDGQSDIWIMPIKGGEKMRLTNDGNEKRRPRWHPDGRRILYNVQRDDFQQIGQAYTDGRAPVQITRGDSQYEMIDVSADGTKIFYFAFENRSDISGVKIENGEEFEVAAGREYEYWADVSPDGKSIVYLSTIAPQFHKDLIIVKQFGNQTPTLTLEGYNPHWLPDSRHISFVRWSEAGQKYHLFLDNTANGEEEQITTEGVFTPSYGNLPKSRGEIGVEDWLSDGKKFVYLNAKSPKNVWLASLDSGETVKLTNNEKPNVRYNSPLFSADGKRIVFISRETISEKMTFGVWLWEAGAAKQIFSSAGSLRLLGWINSGSEILLGMNEGLKKVIPQDVKLVQVGLTGNSQALMTYKNIYPDTVTLSSDSKTLAFTARQNDKDDIWIAAVSGGEQKKITANGNTRLYYASLEWSPDGKTIFFDKQEQIDAISMFENFK